TGERLRARVTSERDTVVRRRISAAAERMVARVLDRRRTICAHPYRVTGRIPLHHEMKDAAVPVIRAAGDVLDAVIAGVAAATVSIAEDDVEPRAIAVAVLRRVHLPRV